MKTEDPRNVALKAIPENKVHRSWTFIEDKYLCSIVKEYGARNWNTISEAMCKKFPLSLRTSKQCRERWHNNLEAGYNHKRWSIKEQATLLLYHMEFGNRWCDISQRFKDRHNNMVKNRFYTTLRKIRGKIKTMDFVTKNRLELLEVYYMIMVMENYLEKRPPRTPLERKRGIDFMFTLIKDVTKRELEIYKVFLDKKHPLNSSIRNELFILSGLNKTNDSFSPIMAVPTKTHLKDTQSIEIQITIDSILEFCSGGKNGSFILSEPTLDIFTNKHIQNGITAF